MTTLQEITDDIWHQHELGHYIVIPTNGFVKKNGECVMGRGLALQAVYRFPTLPRELGTAILNMGNIVTFFPEKGLITFPVKNNFWEKASLELIENSCEQLINLANHNNWQGPIFIPKVGTGNGRLLWSDVKPILEKYLDSRFVICNY